MRSNIFKSLVLTGLVAVLLSFDVPSGWFKAGSAPDKYDMGTDFSFGRNGKNAATIQSNSNHINGFGTLMQNMLPDKYIGKKIKMSGYMRSEHVKNWAGFWLRVDGEKGKNSLSFDNMQDRAVKGNTNWTRYEIVLDVPSGATNIAFGALLAGTGKIWFDDMKFEVVNTSVRSTGGKPVSADPQNLNFEE